MRGFWEGFGIVIASGTEISGGLKCSGSCLRGIGGCFLGEREIMRLWDSIRRRSTVGDRCRSLLVNWILVGRLRRESPRMFGLRWGVELLRRKDGGEQHIRGLFLRLRR